jgi:hypothetical protein
MTSKPQRILALLTPWLFMALGGLLGLLLAPAAGSEYLELQAASVGAHRLAVFALPAGVLAGLVSLAVSIIGRRRKLVRFVSRLVMGCALGAVLGVLVFIVRFDALIEQKGTAGQLVRVDEHQEGFRWTPALRLVEGDTEYFLGPGYLYPDNTAVAAVDRSSMRLRWIFHCLGNAVSDAVIENGRLSFKTRRPSHTTAYLLDLSEPRVLSFSEE